MKGTQGIKLRRDSAKQMLEAQLKIGQKPEKVDGKTTKNMIPLSTSDINRIKKEIDNINNPKKRGKGRSITTE